MAFTLTPEREQEFADILSRYPNKMAATIPVLHLCQGQNRWISDEVIEFVAQRLEVSTAHVKGVVTFYTIFNQQPVGKHEVWVCKTLSCALRGGLDVLHHCEKRLGVHAGGTTKDGKITLRTAECLAACGQAPMIQVDKDYHENLTLADVDRILDQLRADLGRTMLKYTNYLTRTYDQPAPHTLATYESLGGYKQAPKALKTTREQVVEEMKKANVRGRGGAGFPAGVKWSFMPKQSAKPMYLVVNADEGEPGTFKDRTIMEKNPHAVVEGCIIACFAIGAHAAYIYVRDELHLSKQRLWDAIKEARAKGYLGAKPFGIDYPVEVYVHSGAGAYICGEETSLLNSLEGKRGEPRLKPPFPAQVGAFGCPSTVNNLETIAVVPTVFELGGDTYSQLSSLHHLKDGGCRLFALSGHVKTPKVVEVCVGITMRELIYDVGGGILGDGKLLAVIPGGSSCPIIRAEEMVNAPDEKSPLHPWHGQSFLDVPLGVDTYRGLGSALGTCCAIVLSDKADPVLAFQNLMQFYKHESCGQCTPCREGVGWLERILNKIVGGTATYEEVDQLHDIGNGIMGNTICAFGEGAAMPALAFVQKFRPEIDAYVKNKGKSGTGTLTVGPLQAKAAE